MGRPSREWSRHLTSWAIIRKRERAGGPLWAARSRRRPTSLWETRGLRFPQLGHGPQALRTIDDRPGCPRNADRTSNRPGVSLRHVARPSVRNRRHQHRLNRLSNLSSIRGLIEVGSCPKGPRLLLLPSGIRPGRRSADCPRCKYSHRNVGRRLDCHCSCTRSCIQLENYRAVCRTKTD